MSSIDFNGIRSNRIIVSIVEKPQGLSNALCFNHYIREDDVTVGINAMQYGTTPYSSSATFRIYYIELQ